LREHEANQDPNFGQTYGWAGDLTEISFGVRLRMLRPQNAFERRSQTCFHH
jgi:hypothetical protein